MIELWIAIGLAVLLIAAATVQLMIARRFRQVFTRQKPNDSTSDMPTGKVAVLLAVRGADPSIKNAINGVLDQTYGNFEMHIVVDHASDPAVKIIEGIRDQHKNGNRINLSILEVNSDQCSLKCLSLSQAAEALDDEIEFVVLIDADVSPHSTWLTSLLQPLTDETIGGVTGTQWFEPPTGSKIGTWLRSVWNSGATILTMYFANPWAGSFAMRRRDMTDSDLIDVWRCSMVDDGPIRQALNSLGKRIVFAAELVMVNREECSLAYTIGWSARMLTWSRLHESTFWVTIVHAVLSNFVMLSNFVILAAGLIGLMAWPVVPVSFVALVTAGLLCSASYAQAKRCVNHSLRIRNESELPVRGGQLIWSFVCAAPAHLMFGWACFRSITTRRISWRGIEYSLGRKGKVRRLNHEPFSRAKGPDTDAGPAKHSI